MKTDDASIAELHAELAALVQRDNELDESYGCGTDDGIDDNDRSYYDEDKADLCAEFARVATRLLAATSASTTPNRKDVTKK